MRPVPSSRATAAAITLRAPSSLQQTGITIPKYGAIASTSNCRGRSSLLTRAMARHPAQRRARSKSSRVSGREPSKTASTSPASASLAQLRRTPSASTGSSVWRRPAVSKRFSRMSPSWTACSTTSRVVPAMGVTMARSKPASRLSRVDLPALGRPTMAQSIPSRRTAAAL